MEAIAGSSAPKSDGKDENADEQKEGKFKLFGLSPNWMQCCNNAIGFTITLFFFNILNNYVSSGLVNVNVSSLERRFGLSSTDSAVVVVGFEIAFCLFVIFVAYFGTVLSRPKMVAGGCAVFAVGSFMYSLAHMVSPTYDYGNRQLQVVCALPGTNGTDPGCGETQNVRGYMGLLFVGTFLMGCGAVPPFTLGVAYIEESAPRDLAPIFLAISNSGTVLGPMIGFLVGARFLRYFVDFDTVSAETHGLTVFDPRWVGAWWVGPLISTVLCFFLIVPFLGFPKQMPGTNRNREKRVTETHQDGGNEIANKKDFATTFKDMPHAFWIVIKNPVFAVSMTAGICQAILINGSSAFLAKFVENEFHLTAERAGQMTGAALVPGGVIGHILGGIIISRTKWKIPGILRFCSISLLCNVAIVPIALTHCATLQVPGVSLPYIGDSAATGNVTSRCNVNCKCQEEFFIPVCGEDNRTYFSPCHAGCFRPIYEPNVTLPVGFGACSCVNPVPGGGVPQGRVTSGRCVDEACTTLSGFLAAMFFAIMFSFFTITPLLVVQLRCVPAKLRNFAVGIQWLFIRGLGTIPGPFIYGAVIDTTCIFWQTRQCDGTRGSCWIYDNRQLAIRYMSISMVGNFCASMFYLGSSFLYKPPQEEEKSFWTEKPKDAELNTVDNPAFDNTNE